MRGPAKRRRWWTWLLAAILAAAIVYAGRNVWLRWLGEFLVRAEPPQAAQAAVVLAGGGTGERIMHAWELARQGHVKQVLVSGPRGYYGTNEAEIAIEFARRRGASKEVFVPVPLRARSTVAEARALDVELGKRQLSKVIIVTSNYHTRRVRSVFDRLGSRGIRYIVVAAPDEYFVPENWWRDREGQKTLFQEYIKLLYWWLVE